VKKKYAMKYETKQKTKQKTKQSKPNKGAIGFVLISSKTHVKQF